MAKERLINTRFWNDNWVRKINPLDRYLFLYLLTNERTNISGVYELPLSTMAFETGLDERDLEKTMLPRLEPKAFHKDGWVILPNFPRFQHCESEKVKIGIKRELDALPSHIYEYAINLGYSVERKSGSVSSEKIPRRISIFIRDRGICQYCGKSIEEDSDLEIDHIIPLAKGGSDNYENTITSCRICNQDKSDKTALEYCGRDIKGKSYHSEKALKELKNDDVLAKRVAYIYPTLINQSTLSYTKPNLTKPNTSEETSLIPQVIKLFEEVNLNCKNFYGNKTQRSACQFLLDTYGFEKIEKVVSILPQTNQMPYFPTVTTPVQLRDKWSALESAYRKKSSEIKSKQKIVWS